jgi:cytochrome c-type biogenesis protein CcmH/NrfF
LATSRRSATGDVLLLLLLGLVVVAIVVAAVASRPSSFEDRAAYLERGIRCPVCQGVSIADSPSITAREMRDVVTARLAAGATDDEVRAFFVERYGRWILLDPPARGIDLLVWLTPAVVVVAGSGLIIAMARRGRRTPDPRTVPLPGARPHSSAGATAATLLAILLAIGVPVAIATAPRGGGGPVTGTSAQVAPSLAELEAAAQADPANVPGLVALGEAYLAADRGPEAANTFQRVLVREPQNPRALLGLAVLLLGSGRPGEAGPLLDRVLGVAPDDADARLYRAVARVAVEGGLTPEAKADALRFLQLAPNDPRRTFAEQLLSARSPSPSPSPS